MTRKFWEIVKDDRSRTFEVLPFSTDDTDITNKTVDMQKAGMQVHCETIDVTEVSRDEISDQYAHIDYREEEGLMARLRYEYRRRTDKNPRK